ncbi:hypothetical protein IFT83_19345 [Massilia sp. CFBP 13647]|nr:hypothetical protein [Massilia sp. CFBP 13647]MBD8675610.1 hypothetical protein [Massilia sp. CFBP 13721]
MTVHIGHDNDHDHDHDHSHGHDHPVQPELKQHRRTREELTHIKGWGADLDHKNRPAVPMERTPPRYTPADAATPQPQEQRVEVLVSNERPGITQLHGTVQPPSGLSGMLRRAAFKFSENDIRHWLILLGADRINVVEGIVEDLSHGHVPNILGEMGLKSEWQHNKAGLAKKVAIAGAIGAAAYFLLKDRKEDRYDDHYDDRY